METKSEYRITELGEIPAEWAVNKINDIAEVQTGGTPLRSNSNFWKNGTIPWMSSGEVNKKFINQVDEKITEEGFNNSNTTMLPKGTVMLAMNGQGKTRGTVAYLKIETTCNQSLAGIIVNKTYNSLFLYYFLEYSYDNLRNINGEGRSGLNLKLIRDFKVIVPSLYEQQKIAEILSTVDEQIEQTDQLIEKTKELKKGLMQQLLTKGIGHTEFKHSEIGEIPVEWEVKELKKVLEKVVGGGTPSRKNSEFYVGNIPWITVKDMKGHFYQGHSQESINEDAIKKSATNLIEPGNVVIATRMALGKGFINTKSIAINQDLKALYLNQDKVYNPYFLYWYASNAKQIESLGSGTTVKGIRVEQLTKLKMPLPPTEEQKKIAEILSSVDEDIEGYEEEKAKYEELKKGLMQQLLTGKTRVKVD